MRMYEIYTKSGSVFRIQCDEIPFHNGFLRQTVEETLCLFRNKRLIAMFKEWITVVDISEK
jgi:hypothetical protein